MGYTYSDKIFPVHFYGFIINMNLIGREKDFY